MRRRILLFKKEEKNLKSPLVRLGRISFNKNTQKIQEKKKIIIN